MRILVIARWYPSHEVPGRGSFVADQVAALAGAGAQVAVICPDPVYAEGLDGPERAARIARIERWAATIGADLPFAAPIGRGAPGVPVLRIPAPLPAGGDATRDPLALAALEASALVPIGTALHVAWPFDVIHAHTGLPDGLAASALADALRVPLLTSEHDSTTPAKLADPAAAAAYRGLAGPGRALVAASRALAAKIEEQLGPDADRIQAVPNVLPVDTFRIRPDDGRDPNELLWVGSRKESKGTDTLLGAFALLHRERPALRLRLIGRASSEVEEQRLAALSGDLGIAAAVRFEPPADRAGVADAMARATLFVHPSPWETFGVVAVEALAMGLPIAATPSGGVEEILGPDGRCGTIARDHTPAGLAEAIADALDRRAAFDPAVLRAHVVRRYAPGVVAADLLARFEALGVLSATARSDGPGIATGDRIDLPIVVVGFRRSSALARIPMLPPGLAARLAVVTSGPVHPLTGRPTGDPSPRIDVRHWADADIGEEFRARLAALGDVPARSLGKWRTLRHPVRAIRRRRLWAAQPALFAQARGRAVAEVIAALRGPSGSTPVMVLPLDIDDLEPIEPLLVDGRVLLAPGTLGWLVDRWESGES
jgi:glycosyltransferase involved in cell wall biosynthesis